MLCQPVVLTGRNLCSNTAARLDFGECCVLNVSAQAVRI